MLFDNNQVYIDLDAIRNNIRAAKEKAGVPVMGIIKADAYGHGAVSVAHSLEDLCSFFGVSSVAEAIELQQAGITLPILILGHSPVSVFPEAVARQIRLTIFRYEDAVALSEEACRQGKTAYLHLAVDTGMSRIGFQVDAASADLCARIASLPNLYAEGLFSHLATADSADLTRTRGQKDLFDSFITMLQDRGVSIPLCHLDNSAGLMNLDTHYNMVRAGIITYGLCPSDEVDPALLNLAPAMCWHSRVAYVKTLPAGREIGYGATYTTTAPTRVATIPVGYADGYRRSLSGKFYVLIHGQKAPLLGRICMDQIMVDVTAIEDVQVGDTVVLLGSQGEETITAEDISAAAGSFPYEFICGISRRVPRYYIRNGEVIQSLNYLLDK